jgi:hypothetical protein
VHFGDDHSAVLLATRAIEVGEELTISYIENEQEGGVEARRKELAPYGFVCDCARCETEAAEGAGPVSGAHGTKRAAGE